LFTSGKYAERGRSSKASRKALHPPRLTEERKDHRNETSVNEANAQRKNTNPGGEGAGIKGCAPRSGGGTALRSVLSGKDRETPEKAFQKEGVLERLKKKNVIS